MGSSRHFIGTSPTTWSAGGWTPTHVFVSPASASNDIRSLQDLIGRDLSHWLVR